MAERLAVDPVVPSPAAIARAAGALRDGGLVAFPTESFYGLGAAALDAAAVARIFALKARPEWKPVLVLVDSVSMAQTVTAGISEQARGLMARHWPGPLTLVLRAAPDVPAALTAGTGTIGVRLSAHPVARALVQALGQPVTAPSANPAGLAPASTADAVLSYFPDGLALVLDGGPTAGGPPSTVLDVTVDPPRVLRAGAVPV